MAARVSSLEDAGGILRLCDQSRLNFTLYPAYKTGLDKLNKGCAFDKFGAEIHRRTPWHEEKRKTRLKLKN